MLMLMLILNLILMLMLMLILILILIYSLIFIFSASEAMSTLHENEEWLNASAAVGAALDAWEKAKKEAEKAVSARVEAKKRYEEAKKCLSQKTAELRRGKTARGGRVKVDKKSGPPDKQYQIFTGSSSEAGSTLSDRNIQKEQPREILAEKQLEEALAVRLQHPEEKPVLALN